MIANFLDVHLMVVSLEVSLRWKVFPEPQLTGRTFKCSVQQRWTLSYLELTAAFIHVHNHW